MDKYDIQLALLIEDAISECENVMIAAIEMPAVQEALKVARFAMQGYLDSAYAGRLPRPATTRGLYFCLGLSDGFAGVHMPYEMIRLLMEKASKVDEFYGNDCKTPRLA